MPTFDLTPWVPAAAGIASIIGFVLVIRVLCDVLKKENRNDN